MVMQDENELRVNYIYEMINIDELSFEIFVRPNTSVPFAESELKTSTLTFIVKRNIAPSVLFLDSNDYEINIGETGAINFVIDNPEEGEIVEVELFTAG